MKQFKSFIIESIKAEDYEASIVMGFYEITGRTITSNPTKYGISDKVFKMVQQNDNAKEAGRKIAQAVLKEFPELKNAQAEQYGRAKATLTSFWTSHGASDITPKTDVLIGNKRFSVKIGIAQLMSGGKAESTATFQAAIKNSNPELVKSPQYTKTTGVLENFVKSTLAPSQLRPLIKAGTNEVVNKAEKAHKDCMEELGKLFDESKSFKVEFAREAMSGYEKFGKDSNAAAEFMLVANADGGRVVIHSVDDDDYCLKIANAMKLQARFKTSSRKLKGKKTGEYNFWSVISLIVDSMAEETYPEGMTLQEQEDLHEFKVFKKLKGFLSKTWSSIKGIFQKTATKLLSFLSVTPVIKIRSRIKF